MLGDDIAAALPELRAQAESRMRDTWVITRPGAQVWNPATKQYEGSVVTVYDGPGRLRPTALMDHATTAADQEFMESQYVLSLPIGSHPNITTGTSGDVRKDNVATCTKSADDPAMVGRKYTIGISAAHSQATARRFPVTETS
jgi:hypothetical protein